MICTRASQTQNSSSTARSWSPSPSPAARPASARRRVLIGVSRAIEYDIRNAFFAHLQRLPLAYFHANRTGDLMSRATNDLSAVRMMVGPAVMYYAQHGAHLRRRARGDGVDQPRG